MSSKKIKRVYIPAGPTVVWKKNPRTGRKEPKMVQRKGYYKTIVVNF